MLLFKRLLFWSSNFSRTETEKHFMVPKAKKCSKNDEDMQKGQRIQFEEGLTDQTWKEIKPTSK